MTANTYMPEQITALYTRFSQEDALDGDRKKWIVDKEVVAVVKWIFDLCITRKGSSQIAKILKVENVLIAKAYYAKKKGKALPNNPYNWKDSSIAGILERMGYCGHTVRKYPLIQKKLIEEYKRRELFRKKKEAIYTQSSIRKYTEKSKAKFVF